MGSSSYSTITNSYFSSSGDVSASSLGVSSSGGSSSGGSSSGGLVGRSEETLAITHSYFSGSADISASSNSGGLVGFSEDDSTLTITRSYFAGFGELSSSSSGSSSGGLVGSGGSSSTVSITNSYWNTDATQNVGVSEQSPKRARGDVTTEPSGTIGLTLMQLQATSGMMYPSDLLSGVASTEEAWDLGIEIQLPAVKLCVNPTTTNGVTICASYDSLLPSQR